MVSLSLAWFFGILGGLSAVAGIITAVEVIAPLAPELTWMFWFVLSAVLLLVTIVFTIATTSGGGYED